MTAVPPKFRKKKRKIWLSVGAKLIGLIAILLAASTVTIVHFSTQLFIEDNTSLIQQINSDKAASLASQLRESFDGLTEKMRVLATYQLVKGSAPGQATAADSFVNEFFAKDKDFMALLIHSLALARETEPFALHSTTRAPGAEGDSLTPELAAPAADALAQAGRGEVTITKGQLPDGTLVLKVSLPLIQAAGREGEFTHVATAVVRPARFGRAFAESDILTSYLVDRRGRLLAHPDAARVAADESVASVEIVKQMLEGKFNNGQTRYVDPVSGEAKLGAFRLAGFAGLGVVTEVPEAKAFEAARRVRYRATLIGLMVLCGAFLAGYLYSRTITWPLKLLMEASRRISEGDFKIQLAPRGNDEVAHLSLAFNEMATGLRERDRVKATFAKFHSKEMAEKVLSGDLNLGGERKNATVFFSDVRGFTALGERLAPETLVKVLNRYMTRMVRVILSHGGIVDKYVGDAIMAVWGVPLSKEGDTERAILACLGMRQALEELNRELIAEGMAPLRIGMGLNYGPLISGNIGSDERMEYTVIGDTVNTASRVESLTKEFGTDLLVSAEVLAQVPAGRFIAEKAHETRVKGKTEPLVIYRVLGYVEAGKEVRIETPYSSYAAEKSDKVVHDDKKAA